MQTALWAKCRPRKLLVVLAASGLLAREQFFRILFWVQVSFYAIGVIGGLAPALQQNAIIRVASYFTMVQWATLLAWWKYMRGHYQVTWNPSKREQIIPGDYGSKY